MKAYQLKIAIKGSKPPIWRRCIIPAGLTFSQLSILLNKIMGWSGYHLFEFEFYHLSLRITEEDDEDFMDWDTYESVEANKTFINQYMEEQDWFTYTYDFGDNWDHRVTIEDTIEDYEYDYPQVIKFKGACPMEDCGGIYGYYDCLEIMEDEAHPEYEHRNEWAISQGYQKEYDLEAVNESLQQEFVITYGKADNRLQTDIYMAMIAGEKGLIASKTARNNKRPVKSKSEVGKEKAEKMLQKILNRNIEDFNPFKDVTGAFGVTEDTLEDIFYCYEKDFIKMVAKGQGVPKYFTYNKDELILRTIEYILEPDIMKAYFSCLLDEEIDAFESAVKEGVTSKVNNVDLFDKLLVGGYVGITYEHVLTIPSRVAEAYHNFANKEFQKERQKRSFLLACFIAAKNLYGIAPITVIAKMYNQNSSASGKRDVIKSAAVIDEYEKIPKGLRDFEIQEKQFISNEFLSKDLYQAIKLYQGDKKFYIPTEEEIISFSIDGYLPNDQSMIKFKFFLQYIKGIEPKEVELICGEIQNAICMGGEIKSVTDILGENFKVLEIDAAPEEYLPIIFELWNDTRMITNRGFKPNELDDKNINLGKMRTHLGNNTPQNKKIIAFPKQNQEKIYPNAPCPCGSKKKYKHCCGKNK